MNRYTQQDSSLQHQDNRDKLFLWLVMEYSQFHQRKTLSIDGFVFVPDEEQTPMSTQATKWCVII